MNIVGIACFLVYLHLQKYAIPVNTPSLSRNFFCILLFLDGASGVHNGRLLYLFLCKAGADAGGIWHNAGLLVGGGESANGFGRCCLIFRKNIGKRVVLLGKFIIFAIEFGLKSTSL